MYNSFILQKVYTDFTVPFGLCTNETWMHVQTDKFIWQRKGFNSYWGAPYLMNQRLATEQSLKDDLQHHFYNSQLALFNSVLTPNRSLCSIIWQFHFARVYRYYTCGGVQDEFTAVLQDLQALLYYRRLLNSLQTTKHMWYLKR